MHALELFLTPHTYLCFSGRFCVFLDLERDRYLCVNREDLDALASRLHGYPAGARLDKEPASSGTPQLAAEMLAINLLTTDPAIGKPVAPTPSRAPTQCVRDSTQRSSRWASAKAAYRFFSAARAARRGLGRPIATVVRGVRERKQFAAREERTSPEKVIALTQEFLALRSYFPRNYLCLFDSFALVEYLARSGIYADWVFGVSAEPFEAHCWVQTDGVVLNDTLEDVSTYVPIMTV